MVWCNRLPLRADFFWIERATGVVSVLSCIMWARDVDLEASGGKGATRPDANCTSLVKSTLHGESHKSVPLR